MAGVALGCWLLLPLPRLAAATGGAFLLTAIAARWRFEATLGVVLFFAYTATGLLLAAGPLAAATPIWVAAIIGVLAGGVSWTRWSAPGRWRWPVIAWSLGVALSWPVIVAREADFSLYAPRDTPGIVLTAALGMLAAGLWLDVVLAWDSKRIERRVAWPLLASAIVTAIAALYQGLVDLTWFSAEPWPSNGRAIGLMADANPTAVATALWAPLAIAVLRRGRLLIAGVPIAALLWYAAWLTGSRSFVLLFAAGVTGLCGGAIAARFGSRRALLATAAVLTLGVALVGVASSRLPKDSPLGRLVRTLPFDSIGRLAYEALWNRDGYGTAAARAIREQPLSGVGIGAFNPVASYYHRLAGGWPLPPDNAQNLWRHALAERGVLAFPAVVLFTLAGVRMWRRPTAAPPLVAWCLKAIVAGLALSLSFGLPTQNPAIAVTAASLLAWLRAIGTPDETTADRRAPRALTAAWVLAIAGVAVDVWAARTDLRPPWRATRVGDRYAYGFGEAESAPNGVRGRRIGPEAVIAMPVNASQYELQGWNGADAPRRLRVWSNQQFLLDERVQPGTMVRRVIDLPPGRAGLMLEFRSRPPGMLITGGFAGEQ